MKAQVLGLILAAGCELEEHGRRATVPGGPSGTGVPGTPVDAPEDTGDGVAAFLGRVCVAPDLRAPTSNCAVDGAGGIAVALGTQSTLTEPDGSFAIQVPSGSALTWIAIGPQIVPSLMPFSAETIIPAMSRDRYATLLGSNGLILNPGSGSIVGRVVQAGLPAVGATVDTNPIGPNATLYDGVSPEVWDQDSTGAFGVAWVPGVPIGAAAFRVTPPSGSAQTAVIAVEDQAITFLTVEIP